MNPFTKLSQFINNQTEQRKDKPSEDSQGLEKSAVEKLEAEVREVSDEEGFETDSTCWDEEADESGEEKERPQSRYADEGLNSDILSTVLDRAEEVRTALDVSDLDCRPPSVYADNALEDQDDIATAVEDELERPPSRYADEELNTLASMAIGGDCLSAPRPPSSYADEVLYDARPLTEDGSSYAEAEAWETDSDESFWEMAEDTEDDKEPAGPRPESCYADAKMEKKECSDCLGNPGNESVCACPMLIVPSGPAEEQVDTPRPASSYAFDRPESRYADELLNVVSGKCEKYLFCHSEDPNLESEDLNCSDYVEDLTRPESRYADQVLNEAKDKVADPTEELSEVRPASRYCDDALDLEKKLEECDLNGSQYCFEMERPESGFAEEVNDLRLPENTEKISDDEGRPLSRYSDAQLESTVPKELLGQQTVASESGTEVHMCYADESLNVPLPNSLVCL